MQEAGKAVLQVDSAYTTRLYLPVFVLFYFSYWFTCTVAHVDDTCRFFVLFEMMCCLYLKVLFFLILLRLYYPVCFTETCKQNKQVMSGTIVIVHTKGAERLYNVINTLSGKTCFRFIVNHFVLVCYVKL